MAKVSLSQIRKRVDEVINTKQFNKTPIIVTKGSTKNLLKGFMLYETPKSVSLCLWFLPDIQLDNQNGLPGYYQFLPFKGNPSNSGLSHISKYDYSKEKILDHLVEMIDENIQIVQSVKTLADLERVIDIDLKNKTRLWGVNTMSWIGLANYAIWLCKLNNYDKALKYIALSIENANEQYSSYQSLLQIQKLLKNADKSKLSEFLIEQKKETVDKLVEAGFYKNL